MSARRVTENAPSRRPVRTRRAARLIAVAAIAVPLVGCDPVSLTLFGVGTAAGVSHTLSGIAYKTFTAPQKKVSKACSIALDRMGIAIEKRETGTDGVETITAKALDRSIEVVLEPLSPKATRMRSTAKVGILMDQATATEIILQTEQALAGIK
jgi:hypothetical protein